MVVAGAGYLGRRVLEALPDRATVAIGRREPPAGTARAFMALDLDSPIDAPVTIDQPYALLYTAPPPATGSDDPRLERLLVNLATPPMRLVLISTTGVYGDRGGEDVRETDPVSPDSDRAKRRVAAEQHAAAFASKAGIPLVILRVPGIYGPGRLGLDRLAAGGEVLADADSGPGNRIHVDDLVTCCLAALREDSEPGVYNVGDGDNRSSAAFSRAIAELAGLPAPISLSLEEARRRWSPMRFSFALESRRVDTGKMQRVLGVSPRYADPLDGIRASLEAEALD